MAMIPSRRVLSHQTPTTRRESKDRSAVGRGDQGESGELGDVFEGDNALREESMPSIATVQSSQY